MANHEIKQPKDFKDTVRKFEITDKCEASILNEPVKQLINNDLYLKENLENNKLNLEKKINELKTSDIKENIVTFNEVDSRNNVNSGETSKELFGKIKRWLTDLKELAFKDKISANDLEETLKNYIDAKVDISNVISNTGESDTKKIASAAVTSSLQQQINEINQNLYSLSGGTRIEPYTDLNNIDAIGNYYCELNVDANTLINCPCNIAFTLKIERANGTSYPCQTLKLFTTRETFYRHKQDNGLWTEWLIINISITQLFDLNCATRLLNTYYQGAINTPYTQGLTTAQVGICVNFGFIQLAFSYMDNSCFMRIAGDKWTKISA